MATTPSGRDPRVGAAREADVRPVVAVPTRGVPWWVIAFGAMLAGLLLFSILDSRRRALSAPAIKPRGAEAFGGAATRPAPLYVPPVAPDIVPAPVVVAPPPVLLRLPPPPTPQRIFYPPPPVSTYTPPVQIAPAPTRGAAEPVLVVDNSVGDAPTPSAAGGGGGGGTSGTVGVTSATTARAGYLHNRTTTVPQGTLIPAVLETALDSTRPGLARALVQSDVRGFDGEKVLIQRGSRLIGEYRADLRAGQNRALVTWTRLVRPDGVTIALNSPAADPLGRVGIKGKVNSHFFERFGAAILQSSLDVGVNLASRVGGDNSAVAIALPGAVQGTGSLTNGNQIQPTLRIRQGTPISVFVARDLDFTSVEGRR